MSQLPAIPLTATPKDVTAGLDAGGYLAQCRPKSARALYATRETAPSDSDDYFVCSNGSFFTFRAGEGCSPTWVRTVDPLVPATLALARLD